MARILVTGGAGYVGSVCCLQLLERGHRVTVVDDLSTGHARAVPQGALLQQLNIGDRYALAAVLAADRFDAVFHFAAKALIAESVTNPGIFFHSNVASSIAMLETIRAAGIRKFVFSSSAAVYGNAQSTSIDEDHPKNPTNSYGESKLALERMLYWYAISYRYSIRSSASLLSPYEFVGFLGWSSSIEVDCALPYTAAEEENTNLRMPAARMVSSMAMLEATFE